MFLRGGKGVGAVTLLGFTQSPLCNLKIRTESNDHAAIQPFIFYSPKLSVIFARDYLHPLYVKSLLYDVLSIIHILHQISSIEVDVGSIHGRALLVKNIQTLQKLEGIMRFLLMFADNGAARSKSTPSPFIAS